MKNDANGWLYLRHPKSFTDKLFECFRASCYIWCATVEATIKMWESLPAFRVVTTKPEYEFGDPQISNDKKTVVLPYFCSLSHGAKNLFIDPYPTALYKFLPNWFLLDLELGRQSIWFPQLTWTRLHSPEEVNLLRQHILFTPSTKGDS